MLDAHQARSPHRFVKEHMLLLSPRPWLDRRFPDWQ